MLLFEQAIYVNRSKENVLRAAEQSKPLVDKKPWRTGEKLWQKAIASGKQLPLIFSHYRELTYWAVATSVKVRGSSTRFTFANLQSIDNHERCDLKVVSTEAQLPNTFIRSYAIVFTPPFLSSPVSVERALPEIDPEAEELFGLEGKALHRLVLHRRRERKAREAKIAQWLARNAGTLPCEVPGCGFDFRTTYGDLGNRYAQVHHLQPLADVVKERVPKLEDLVVVCANCHAMIHRNGGCRRLEEIRVTRRVPV